MKNYNGGLDLRCEGETTHLNRLYGLGEGGNSVPSSPENDKAHALPEPPVFSSERRANELEEVGARRGRGESF